MLTTITIAAAPLVAGLVAYYRGLPLREPWKTQLQKPSIVKALITHFHRRLDINDRRLPPDPLGLQDVKPVVWNAQVFTNSCLIHERPWIDDNHLFCGDPLPDDLGTLSPNGGEPVQGNGGDINGGQTITYQSGTPSPTCTTNCGTLCTGYYCEPNPTGTPPDFTDPINSSPAVTRRPTDLPELPDPTKCAFKTTTTRCNGSGGNRVCMPVEVCTIPTDLPTFTPRPSVTPTGSCLASGAVSTCAMGPGQQMACITSTACTDWAEATPTTPKSTPPRPSPTPQHGYIIIALEEYLISYEQGGAWDREWDVFSSPLDGGIRLCTARSVFSQKTTTATGMTPGFPPTLGPFEAQGFTCTYKAPEDDKLGILECAGVRNMWCEEAEKGFEEPCALSNPVIVARVVCRW